MKSEAGGKRPWGCWLLLWVFIGLFTIVNTTKGDKSIGAKVANHLAEKAMLTVIIYVPIIVYYRWISRGNNKHRL